MRLLVTGGRGFIGAATVRAAIAAGHDVAVLVRPGRDHGRLADVANRLTWIHGDLTQLISSRVRASCASFRPDTIVHAGWDGVRGADRNAEWQVTRNVPAAMDLVRLAALAGARQFVALGSQAEYGACSGRITESQPLRPTTLYGAAKVAAAAVTRTMCDLHGLSHTWLRVFSTYGPGADAGWVLPMAARGLAAGTAPALTRCEQRWEFLHVRDAAAAVLACAEQRAAGTFNLGSGDAPVLRDVLLGLRDRIAPHVEPHFGATPYRPDQVMHLEADITRLHDATGWWPAIALDAGLDELAAIALADARPHAHV